MGNKIQTKYGEISGYSGRFTRIKQFKQAKGDSKALGERWMAEKPVRDIFCFLRKVLTETLPWCKFVVSETIPGLVPFDNKCYFRGVDFLIYLCMKDFR